MGGRCGRNCCDDKEERARKKRRRRAIRRRQADARRYAKEQKQKAQTSDTGRGYRTAGVVPFDGDADELLFATLSGGTDGRPAPPILLKPGYTVGGSDVAFVATDIADSDAAFTLHEEERPEAESMSDVSSGDDAQTRDASSEAAAVKGVEMDRFVPPHWLDVFQHPHDSTEAFEMLNIGGALRISAQGAALVSRFVAGPVLEAADFATFDVRIHRIVTAEWINIRYDARYDKFSWSKLFSFDSGCLARDIDAETLYNIVADLCEKECVPIPDVAPPPRYDEMPSAPPPDRVKA